MIKIASKYGIITIANLQEYSNRTYSSYADKGGTREYSDANIEAKISHWERLVCARTKQTYDSSSAPDEVVAAVTECAALDMENVLIKDKWVQGDMVDVMDYFWKNHVPFLESEREEGAIEFYGGVDDWE